MNATSANSGEIMKQCQHCGAKETPQWREGPLGPKTLCNACGMRYRSGRLVPEYRPAKSPTFCSQLHSNSHRQVLQMRSMKQPMWMFRGVDPDNKGSVEICTIKSQGADATVMKKPESHGAGASAQKELKSQGSVATAQKEPKSQGSDAAVQKEPKSQGANATALSRADAPAPRDPKSQCTDATSQKEPKSQGADATSPKEPKSQGADTTAQVEPKSLDADATKKREPMSQDANSTLSNVKKEYRHRRAKETPKWWQKQDARATPKTMRKQCPHPRAKETPQWQERQDSSTICKTMKKECQHCRTDETPQWREGPLGPNTLCNACGLRYRSGRLFPEYRPAKSPTFSNELYSNSDKQIFQMRSADQPKEMFWVESDDKRRFVDMSTKESQSADAIGKKKPKYEAVDLTVKEEASVEGNLHPLSYEVVERSFTVLKLKLGQTTS